MNRESLENYLTQYFKEHPDTTEDELLTISRSARKSASLMRIPAYKPLEVVDKKEISLEFKEELKKIKQKVYRDEATHDYKYD